MTNRWKYGVLFLASSMSVACGDDDSDGDDEEGVAPPSDAGTASADSAACSAVSYDNFGKQFFTTYCQTCHGSDKTGTARMAAPMDDVFDTVAQIRAKKGEIEEQAVDSKMMPFGASSTKPSDADRAKLGAWLACGAP